MDDTKKLTLIHYLTEFILFMIGVGILLILLWLENFEFSLKILSFWVLIFNAILFSFWSWKSKSKIWEKSIALIYFLLIEIIIINAIKAITVAG
tara:strand:- start:1557 stop:1838 length:282 start_codon:yes stop_codon:yes gene_type:complete